MCKPVLLYCQILRAFLGLEIVKILLFAIFELVCTVKCSASDSARTKPVKTADETLLLENHNGLSLLSFVCG